MQQHAYAMLGQTAQQWEQLSSSLPQQHQQQQQALWAAMRAPSSAPVSGFPSINDALMLANAVSQGLPSSVAYSQLSQAPYPSVAHAPLTAQSQRQRLSLPQFPGWLPRPDQPPTPGQAYCQVQQSNAFTGQPSQQLQPLCDNDRAQIKPTDPTAGGNAGGGLCYKPETGPVPDATDAYQQLQQQQHAYNLLQAQQQLQQLSYALAPASLYTATPSSPMTRCAYGNPLAPPPGLLMPPIAPPAPAPAVQGTMPLVWAASAAAQMSSSLEAAARAQAGLPFVDWMPSQMPPLAQPLPLPVHPLAQAQLAQAQAAQLAQAQVSQQLALAQAAQVAQAMQAAQAVQLPLHPLAQPPLHALAQAQAAQLPLQALAPVWMGHRDMAGVVQGGVTRFSPAVSGTTLPHYVASELLEDASTDDSLDTQRAEEVRKAKRLKCNRDSARKSLLLKNARFQAMSSDVDQLARSNQMLHKQLDLIAAAMAGMADHNGLLSQGIQLLHEQRAVPEDLRQREAAAAAMVSDTTKQLSSGAMDAALALMDSTSMMLGQEADCWDSDGVDEDLDGTTVVAHLMLPPMAHVGLEQEQYKDCQAQAPSPMAQGGTGAGTD